MLTETPPSSIRVRGVESHVGCQSSAIWLHQSHHPIDRMGLLDRNPVRVVDPCTFIGSGETSSNSRSRASREPSTSSKPLTIDDHVPPSRTKKTQESKQASPLGGRLPGTAKLVPRKANDLVESGMGTNRIDILRLDEPAEVSIGPDVPHGTEHGNSATHIPQCTWANEKNGSGRAFRHGLVRSTPENEVDPTISPARSIERKANSACSLTIKVDPTIVPERTRHQQAPAPPETHTGTRQQSDRARQQLTATRAGCARNSA